MQGSQRNASSIPKRKDGRDWTFKEAFEVKRDVRRKIFSSSSSESRIREKTSRKIIAKVLKKRLKTREAVKPTITMLKVSPTTIKAASLALPLDPAKMRGRTGSTHGEKTEIIPRAKAINISSIKIEKRDLI
jgi:hypothetical protein